jgi:alpha-tubulin suppressor-like RCC1 family protein
MADFSFSSLQLTEIAVGNGYACGRALWSNGVGEATCVGDNSFGVMGYDPSTTPYVPLGESFQILNNGTTSHVAAHTNFTCWDENNGTVQCVGEGDNGQLGNGQSTGTLFGVGSFNPITVGGGMQLSHVTTGYNHACALDPSGNAWCWGLVGLLGDGENPQTATQLVRGPVPVSGGITFIALAAGDKHTCGIGTDNHIYCWGLNVDGQLGTGTWGYGWVTTPVQALDPTN